MPAWSGTTCRRASALTYDLTGDGRTVVSSSYAIYFGQMSPGQLSSQLAATGAVFVRYPWTDTNGDRFVQADEVNTAVPFLSKSTAYDPANPTQHDVADPRRSERQERSHASNSSPASIASWARRWRSAPATSGASTIASSGTIATTWTSANYRAVQLQATDLPRRCALRGRDLLRADQPAAVGQRLHQPSRPLPRLQRLRSDVHRSAWRTAGR